MPHTRAGANLAQTVSPIDHPAHGLILPIGEVFERLRGAVGRSFPDTGWDEERNRGAALHRIVCELLGYADYRHDGRFPDVRNQLLEVKLHVPSRTFALMSVVCHCSSRGLRCAI